MEMIQLIALVETAVIASLVAVLAKLSATAARTARQNVRHSSTVEPVRLPRPSVRCGDREAAHPVKCAESSQPPISCGGESRENEAVVLLPILALFLLIPLMLCARGYATESATGEGVDVATLRWQREVRVFDQQSSSIRADIERVRAQSAAVSDEAARRRYQQKLTQLTIEYFEGLSNLYRSYVHYMDAVIDRYETALGSASNASAKVSSSSAGVRETRSDLIKEKRTIEQMRDLPLELNAVLGESVLDPDAYAGLLATVDRSLNELRSIDPLVEQSRRRQVHDRASIRMSLQQFRVRRAVAEALAASYRAASETGRRIAATTDGALADGGDVEPFPQIEPLPSVDAFPLPGESQAGGMLGDGAGDGKED